MKNRIIKLLTPSFVKSNLNPGYIRRYVNGVRENGVNILIVVVYG